MKIFSWIIDTGLWLYGSILSIFSWAMLLFLILFLISEISNSQRIKNFIVNLGDWTFNIISIITMPFTFLLSIILAIPIIGWIVSLAIALIKLIFFIIMFLINALIFEPIRNLFAKQTPRNFDESCALLFKMTIGKISEFYKEIPKELAPSAVGSVKLKLCPWGFCMASLKYELLNSGFREDIVLNVIQKLNDMYYNRILEKIAKDIPQNEKEKSAMSKTKIALSHYEKICEIFENSKNGIYVCQDEFDDEPCEFKVYEKIFLEFEKCIHCYSIKYNDYEKRTYITNLLKDMLTYDKTIINQLSFSQAKNKSKIK